MDNYYLEKLIWIYNIYIFILDISINIICFYYIFNIFENSYYDYFIYLLHFISEIYTLINVKYKLISLNIDTQIEHSYGIALKMLLRHLYFYYMFNINIINELFILNLIIASIVNFIFAFYN